MALTARSCVTIPGVEALTNMEVPDIQYTRSGDVAVAYQVVGDGPVDVI